MSGAKIPSMEATVCESCETIGSLMLATVRVLIYTVEKGNCYKPVPPLPLPPVKQHTTAWSQEKESFKKRGQHLTAWNATERPNKKGTEKYLSFVGWSTKEPLNREGEGGVEAWPGERVEGEEVRPYAETALPVSLVLQGSVKSIGCWLEIKGGECMCFQMSNIKIGMSNDKIIQEKERMLKTRGNG